MAHFIKPKVRDIVYEHASRPGVVLRVMGPDTYEVLLLDGSVSIITVCDGLAKSFTGLIADHEKKLETHNKALKKLREMIET